MSSAPRVYIRFWTGRYNNCLLIQDSQTGKYGWFWPGEIEYVDPPHDIKVLIDMWKQTQFGNLELGEFIYGLVGED